MPQSAPSELTVGRTLSFRKTMTVAEQAMFTGISGNMGGLYVDAKRAKGAGLPGMVVFELALGALVTTCLWHLGGPGRRIGEIQLEFPEPVFVGESVEAQAEVIALSGETVQCRIVCVRTLPTEGGVIAQGHATLVPVREDAGDV
ncbi:MaoC/PaaZ C-terminal domain-containing protein [Pseudochelatococcus sp. B33]